MVQLVIVYTESWLASRCAVDARVNNIRLTGRLRAFDKAFKDAGLKMMIL